MIIVAAVKQARVSIVKSTMVIEIKKSLSKKGCFAGIPCKAYHAGRPGKERSQVLEDWNDGRLPLVAATIAFGMGIDRAGSHALQSALAQLAASCHHVLKTLSFLHVTELCHAYVQPHAGSCRVMCCVMRNHVLYCAELSDVSWACGLCVAVMSRVVHSCACALRLRKQADFLCRSLKKL